MTNDRLKYRDEYDDMRGLDCAHGRQKQEFTQAKDLCVVVGRLR